MGNNAYKQKHRDLGLCVNCSEPVYRDLSRCLKHARNHAKCDANYYINNKAKRQAKMKKIRARYRDEGRCQECSAPLDPYAIEKGLKGCSNCQGGIKRERLVHGYPIV